MITADLLRQICIVNKIIPRFPLIVVFRNTDKDLNPVPNDGTNLDDLILAVDEDFTISVVGVGRSEPHNEYLELQREGKAGCNMVESQYCEKMWIRGNHLGYTGLVEVDKNYSLVINRENGQIQYGEGGEVGDNFHGYSPASAGCTTVFGCMTRYPDVGRPVAYQAGADWLDHPGDGGDWKNFEAWISQKDPATLYSALWLQHDDLRAWPALRIGSTGETVKALQRALKFALIDGQFGPGTYFAVRALQSSHGLPDDGVVTQKLADILGLVLS